VHQRKFLLSTWPDVYSENFALNRQKLRFLHRLQKCLNLRCSKLPILRLNLYFWPYIQNTVGKTFSQVSTVAFFRFYCRFHTYTTKSLRLDRQEREMLHTTTHGKCCFCVSTTFSVEGGIKMKFWEKNLRRIFTWQFIVDM